MILLSHHAVEVIIYATLLIDKTRPDGMITIDSGSIALS